ncbi:hypothetical protein BB560_002784 [Smittium megazygosporum]|uniref:Mediator of RNA polymerase II transcription subunit 7 n=1 Tax=Smittium megazygosporum TaxID=133381 RepID=A0A2T9ZDX8_9FUNG|nr:hypothetical protein BB560_002784 [Smittium megazygosporum]
MGQEQKISTAFPPPPGQYKLFTNENVLLSKSKFEAEEIGALKYLVPPEPIPEDEYHIFGSDFKARSTSELKRMNVDLLKTFLDLVANLSKDLTNANTTELRERLSKLDAGLNGYRYDMASCPRCAAVDSGSGGSACRAEDQPYPDSD